MTMRMIEIMSLASYVEIIRTPSSLLRYSGAMFIEPSWPTSQLSFLKVTTFGFVASSCEVSARTEDDAVEEARFCFRFCCGGGGRSALPPPPVVSLFPTVKFLMRKFETPTIWLLESYQPGNWESRIPVSAGG